MSKPGAERVKENPFPAKRGFRFALYTRKGHTARQDLGPRRVVLIQFGFAPDPDGRSVRQTRVTLATVPGILFGSKCPTHVNALQGAKLPTPVRHRAQKLPARPGTVRKGGKRPAFPLQTTSIKGKTAVISVQQPRRPSFLLSCRLSSQPSCRPSCRSS